MDARGWVYEHPDWPQIRFRADEVLAAVARLSEKMGRLDGRLADLPLDARKRLEVDALSAEVISSSAIEGVRLPERELRKALANRLGIEIDGPTFPTRDVGFLADFAIDVGSRCHKTLDTERLWAWHSALFPTGFSGGRRIAVARWRNDSQGPMQVVSGDDSQPTVHYVAPCAERLDREMTTFLSWFNRLDTEPLTRAAVAHFWFVTLHPFEDGNGRIGRAIMNLALQGETRDARLWLAVSNQLYQHRSDYYGSLERVQVGGLDVTDWILWFLAILDQALTDAERRAEPYLRLNCLHSSTSAQALSPRQRKLLDLALIDPETPLTTSSWARTVGCSQDSAHRDARALVQLGLFEQIGAGRSCCYRLLLT